MPTFLITHAATGVAVAGSAASGGGVTPGGLIVVAAIAGAVWWMFGIGRGEYRTPLQLLRSPGQDQTHEPQDRPQGAWWRRWRVLPYRGRPAPIPDVGHVNAQVSGQGTPVGGPVGAPWPGPVGAPTAALLPVPAGPGPVQPVTQPAAGVYLSGQGQGVRLDPGPQQVVVPSAVAGGDLAVAQRRAAVADAVPHLQGAPHGEQGRIVAALAAAWRVDPRTIYRDLEALEAFTRGVGQ